MGDNGIVHQFFVDIEKAYESEEKSIVHFFHWI
jgi:hypothetical protein